MNYLQIALRIQARYKWFTLINILGLSLGITCSVIIALYVQSHLSTDSYHADANRIYRLVLDIHTPNGNTEYEEGTALPMAHALQNEYSQIERSASCMKFYRAPSIIIQTAHKSDTYKEDNKVAYANTDFIELFEHDFITGNKHTALSHPKSVVLSEKQALKYFGTVDIIGRLINLNNTDLSVTGVFANQVQSSDLKFDVLVSLPTLKILNPKFQDQNFTWIGNNWTFIKLKDPTNASHVNARLPAFVQKYLGADFKHWQFHLQPLADMHFDTRYDGTINKLILWVLSAVAVALICLVCINYINLSIAQSVYRSKEIGVRKFLGGSKAQLFFQFMSETGIVVVISVFLALTASYICLPILNSWLQVDLALAQVATPDKIAILCVSCVLLVLLAGYYPAVILSGFEPVKAITGKVGKIGGTSQTLRQSLICFQYVIALLFLISTFIIMNQIDFVLKNDLGFAKDAIITIDVPKSNLSALQAFRNELAQMPDVESTSLHHQAPMSATMDGGFIKYDNRSQWEDFIVRDRWADDQFVDTYSLQLVAGRNIVLHDSTTEILVNEALLNKLAITDPNAALGKPIAFDNSSITGTIVGVVRNFHHRSLQNEIEPLAIYPFPGVFNQLGVRLKSNQSKHTLASIKSIWKIHFPNEVLTFSFLDQTISKMYHTEQITGRLMNIFAVVSIIICAIGVLGLSVFTSLQRTKEIGVRKVLGATTFHILFMLCKQYLTLIVIAFVIALPVTYMLMFKWLETFAYRISLGWLVFALPGLLMILITLLVVGGQSLKTALTNPTKLIRQE